MEILRKLTKNGKGVLGEEVKKNPFKKEIASFSFLLYFLPLFIYIFAFNTDVKDNVFITIYILWYFGGLFISAKDPNKIGEYFNLIVLFPFYVSYIISFNIFKGILKIKYPEMEKELYERKIKIIKLKKIIKRNERKFKIF